MMRQAVSKRGVRTFMAARSRDSPARCSGATDSVNVPLAPSGIKSTQSSIAGGRDHAVTTISQAPADFDAGASSACCLGPAPTSGRGAHPTSNLFQLFNRSDDLAGETVVDRLRCRHRDPQTMAAFGTTRKKEFCRLRSACVQFPDSLPLDASLRVGADSVAKVGMRSLSPSASPAALFAAGMRSGR